jgi:hypothetical protein
VLLLNFAKEGNILLAGDLYHFPPVISIIFLRNRHLNRLPTFEFNVQRSAASRMSIDELMRKPKARDAWVLGDGLAIGLKRFLCIFWIAP